MKNKTVTNREIYKKLGEGTKFLLTDYSDENGLYVTNQKILNERKFHIDRCNDPKHVFESIKQEVLKRNPTPTLGLCHGVRSGRENKILGELLNCPVIGTEIGDKFGYPECTIQWDMHDIKEEWIGKCDLIYSNSLDHSYDPIYCLNQWAKCLKPTGVIILQFGHYLHFEKEDLNEKIYSPGDPFNAPISIYKEICNEHTTLNFEGIVEWRKNSNIVHLIMKLK